jgi:predicted RNase H-like HicB family nuclease
MKFNVIFTEEEKGYSIRVPALDGCYTQSETIEEGIEKIKALIPAFFNVINDIDELEVNEKAITIDVSEKEIEKDKVKYQKEKQNNIERIK